MIKLTNKLLLGVIFLSVMFLVGGCSEVLIQADGSVEYREYFEEVFEPSNSFVLNNFMGTVIVEPSTDGKIKVQYCKSLTGSSEERLQEISEDLTVDVTHSESELRIKTDRPYPRPSGVKSMKIEFHVFLPEAILVNIRTSNSSIKLNDLQQDVKISSSNGLLTIENHQGNISAKTSNGRIHLEACYGYLDLRTSNGDIVCNDVKGALKADTSNGGIIVNTTDILQGVNLGSSNGSIKFKGQMVQGNKYYFHTSNANILVWLDSQLGYDLDARTSNGRVNFDFPFQYAGSYNRNNLQGQIGHGGTQLTMKTSNGNILIHGVED